jgi:hypothetical protein
MKLSLLTILIFTFLLLSCSKDDNPGQNGHVTLSSKFYGPSLNIVYGYSFELEENVPNINAGGKLFDIIAQNILEPSGNTVGAQFSVESGNRNGLLLNDQFLSLEETENYFSNYTTAIDGPWISLSDKLKPFQVYTYKSRLDNFVKFFIKDIRIINNPNEPGYAEIDIHYFIQRDGLPVFEK